MHIHIRAVWPKTANSLSFMTLHICQDIIPETSEKLFCKTCSLMVSFADHDGAGNLRAAIVAIPVAGTVPAICTVHHMSLV